MTKLFTKIRFKQISKFFVIFCAIFLSLNTITVHYEAQAADYDSTTFNPAIDAPIYYGFEPDCTATLTIEDVSGGGSLEATSGNSYGNTTCEITMAYNDPDTDFEVYLYKSENLPLRHNLVDTNGATISDIDNASSDYYIDPSGTDTTDEEWGYRLVTTGGTLGLPTEVTVNADAGGKNFNAQICGSGSDPCTFDFEYSDATAGYPGADNIMSGDNTTPTSALCTNVVAENPDCQFNLIVEANILYATVPGQYGVAKTFTIVVALDPAAQ